MVIIGITITFTLLAFGDFGQGRRVKFECQRFGQLTKLLQQRAMLETHPYGIQIRANDYTFFVFETSPLSKTQKKSGWQQMTREQLFHTRHIAKSITLSFKGSSQTPQIIISPAGVISPFALQLALKTPVCKVYNNLGGTIEIINFDKK
jgi:general secretion pathway protein H